MATRHKNTCDPGHCRLAFIQRNDAPRRLDASYRPSCLVLTEPQWPFSRWLEITCYKGLNHYLRQNFAEKSWPAWILCFYKVAMVVRNTEVKRIRTSPDAADLAHCLAVYFCLKVGGVMRSYAEFSSIGLMQNSI